MELHKPSWSILMHGNRIGELYSIIQLHGFDKYYYHKHGGIMESKE